MKLLEIFIILIILVSSIIPIIMNMYKKEIWEYIKEKQKQEDSIKKIKEGFKKDKRIKNDIRNRRSNH